MGDHPEIEFLGKTEIFQGVSPETLAEIHAAASRKQLAAGEVLFHQADPAKTFYIIENGRLRVTQTTSDGQQVILRYLGPGEVVGYTTMFGDPHPSTVTVVDPTELLVWNAGAIVAILKKHPAIAVNAMTMIGRRYYDMQVRLRELSTENVERRVAHALTRLSEQAGRRTARGVEIAFPLTRQDLAEMTGTTLHTVSRILSHWEDKQIVESGRRRVVVRKPEALMSIAEQQV
jgi:CRP-like cAMP-binding protein